LEILPLRVMVLVLMKLIEAGISDNSDGESWPGLPTHEDSEFVDEAAKLLNSASNDIL
jgi:hypothetical protein